MILGGIVYSSLSNEWRDPSELEVNSGDPLTKDLWNATQSNMKKLGEKISALEGDIEDITSYSTEEVMTNAVWLDDSPIYKKTIPWTSSGVAIGDDALLETSTSIKGVIDAETVAIGTNVFAITRDSSVFVRNGDLFIGNRGANTAWVEGNQWYITIQYIKN